MKQNILYLLNSKVEQYNHIDFIEYDPISIPHQFSKKQDIEIAAFFAAILAWGNRKSILTSCKKLLKIMEHSPYEFIMNVDSNPKWQKQIQSFVHRTFNNTDLEHFINFLHYHYKIKKELSLETAFCRGLEASDVDVENSLNSFYNYFFDENIFNNIHQRTKKHIAAPIKKSACKRLNMFLRWMVRQDNNGVDFGLWKQIKTSQLIMPLDVHVLNVANYLELICSRKSNWQTAVELTNTLKQFDANDPVKYDYALFSLGIAEGFKYSIVPQ